MEHCYNPAHYRPSAESAAPIRHGTLSASAIPCVMEHKGGILCFRCHQPGHKVPDCPLRFDIRLLTNEELENELMNRKDVPPVQISLTETGFEHPKEEDFVQGNE